MQDRGEIRYFKWAGPVETLSSFPVIVFAYTCHQNVRSKYQTTNSRYPYLTIPSRRCSQYSMKSPTTPTSVPPASSFLASARQVSCTSSSPLRDTFPLGMLSPATLSACVRSSPRLDSIQFFEQPMLKHSNRSSLSRFHHWQSCHRHPRHVLLPSSSPPLPCLRRRCPKVASKRPLQLRAQLSPTAWREQYAFGTEYRD